MAEPLEDAASGAAREKLALLRKLRAEVQALQSLLISIRQGKTQLLACAAYITQKKRDIAALFAQLAQAMPDEAVLPSDTIGHLDNMWRQLLCTAILAAPEAKLDSEVFVKQLALCDDLCGEMVAHIGRLTIPARLNEMLADAWTGYLLSFHDLFSKEMPNLADRQQLLRLLASVPGLLKNGIVEPENGLIFPYHKSAVDRFLVCLALGLLMIGATVGIALLGTIPYVQEATGLQPGGLVLNWLLVIAGVLTHIGIERSKGGGTAISVPTSHLMTAIDARSGTVVLRLLLMLFAYGGLLFMGGSTNNGHLNAFLVGYSLDSFVGLFSQTLDKQLVSRGAALAHMLD